MGEGALGAGAVASMVWNATAAQAGSIETGSAMQPIGMHRKLFKNLVLFLHRNCMMHGGGRSVQLLHIKMR